MKKGKRNKLKGFTLIELVVVIATFGLIIAATLSMMQPVMNIFRKTERYAAAEATADNVRRTIEDNLKYANRMLVTVGPSFTNEQTYIKSKVDKLRTEFMLGDSKRITYVKDKVYVLKIDNPETADENDFVGVPSSEAVGKITLWVYEGDSAIPTGESKPWVISEGVYKDYGFSLSAGLDCEYDNKTIAGRNYYPILKNDKLAYKPINTIVSVPSNFTFDLDIYEKYPSKDRTTFTLCRTDAKNKVTNKVTMALTNIVSEATYKQETIKYKDAESKEQTKSPKRYMDPEIETNSNDIYFFYTKPEF